MAIDLMKQSDRQRIIQEIGRDENQKRKEESLRRFEIYRERQRPYILERLKQEFSARSVREMRTFTSINLCKRIVDEVASLYKSAPVRNFQEVSEAEKEHLENLYDQSKTNIKMKLANKYENLEDQCAIHIVPNKKKDKIETRVLLPHHYDVIPDPIDPSKAFAYVINILDRDDSNSLTNANRDLTASPTGGREVALNDNINQKIADQDDYKSSLMRFVWWSEDFNFITDGKGALIDEDTGKTMTLIDANKLANPIPGVLPFVDVAGEKDFEFWIRYGNNICDFAIDYGVVLSDVANINRLQGYSQAVIAAEAVPKDFQVGPHSVIHLELSPDPEAPTPTFEFVTPSPDMSASLELLETYLRLFLTSRGMDPKTISGKGEGKTFNSALERLLSMIEKFEATKDDLDLFSDVEDQSFDIYRAWNNYLVDIGTLEGVKINENAFVQVQFHQPELTQTKQEKEDSTIKLMNEGLKSDVEAVMDLREVEEEEALVLLKAIEDRKTKKAARFFNGGGQNKEEQSEADNQSEGSVRQEFQGNGQPQAGDRPGDNRSNDSEDAEGAGS